MKSNGKTGAAASEAKGYVQNLKKWGRYKHVRAGFALDSLAFGAVEGSDEIVIVWNGTRPGALLYRTARPKKDKPQPQPEPAPATEPQTQPQTQSGCAPYAPAALGGGPCGMPGGGGYAGPYGVPGGIPIVRAPAMCVFLPMPICV